MPSSPKTDNPDAVHFGAGSIGRGFLGQLYFESGFHTTFIDVDPAIIQALNARHAYPLRIAAEESHTLEIANISAIHARDSEACAEAIARATIVSTAVGAAALPHVGPVLAQGIARRLNQPGPQPLNIIVCENLHDAASFLQTKTARHLDPTLQQAFHKFIGFVDASIGRMVPERHPAQDDPLLVTAEPYCELPVDAQAFRGPIPAIRHLLPAPQFAAYTARKLFMHNAGHAATAYLAYRHGITTIHEAIAHKDIHALAHDVMTESAEAIHRKFALPRHELHEHRADLLHRFANPTLGDTVARVARDPLRKLGPHDRFIGAINLCAETGVLPRRLALAAAAAIRYDPPDDPGARAVQQRLQQHGLKALIEDVCQLRADSPMARLILQAHETLQT